MGPSREEPCITHPARALFLAVWLCSVLQNGADTTAGLCLCGLQGGVCRRMCGGVMTDSELSG